MNTNRHKYSDHRLHGFTQILTAGAGLHPACSKPKESLEASFCFFLAVVSSVSIETGGDSLKTDN